MHSKATKWCRLYGDIRGLPPCLKTLFLLSTAERTLSSFVVKFAGHILIWQNCGKYSCVLHLILNAETRLWITFSNWEVYFANRWTVMVHGSRLHVNLLLINKAFLSTSTGSSNRSDTTATPPSKIPWNGRSFRSNKKISKIWSPRWAEWWAWCCDIVHKGCFQPKLISISTIHLL